MVFLEFMISFVGDLVNSYIHLTCFQGVDYFRVLPHPSARQKNQRTKCGSGKTLESGCFLGASFHIFFQLEKYVFDSFEGFLKIKMALIFHILKKKHLNS
jgi:hypothetical protein